VEGPDPRTRLGVTTELRYAVVRRINRLIGEMSGPLPLRERIRGRLGAQDAWTDATREEWRQLLLTLRERVAAGDSSLETEAQHLGRWLDHDGISGGRWADEISAIQDGLRALSAAERS
jgi:hypothetical protein